MSHGVLHETDNNARVATTTREDICSSGMMDPCAAAGFLE
jgi:hypothetical protein